MPGDQEPAMSSSPLDVIANGDWVILDENNERRSFARIQAAKHVRVGKSSIPCDTLIGQPYGSIFELSADRKSASRLYRPPDQEADVRQVDTSKNNSQLCDENKQNQQLTKEDIEAMKAAGKGGDEIIQALISKSVTFQTKTEFSQEKYKKKKAKKYCAYVTVRQPTSSSICQTFFQKEALRVGNLRPDTLAIMLSQANVCAHQRVLVVETLCGLITTSVVERMGGHGRVLALHTNKAAPLDALQYGNFDAAHRGVLLTTGLPDILAAQADVSAPSENGVDPAPLTTPTTASDQAAPTKTTAERDPPTTTLPENQAAAGAQPAPVNQLAPANRDEAGPTIKVPETSEPAPGSDSGAQEASATPMDTDAPVDGSAEQQQGDAAARQSEPAAAAVATTTGEHEGTGKDSSRAPQAPRQIKSHSASEEQLKEMAGKGFHSAILACPHVQPLALLDSIWPLLRPSASFAIFSPGMQPLAECMQALHIRKAAVMMQLQESWMRQHQVLPGRTHPEMMTTGTGGYILSGVKVVMAGDPVKNVQSTSKRKSNVTASVPKKAAETARDVPSGTVQTGAGAAIEVGVEGKGGGCRVGGEDKAADGQQQHVPSQGVKRKLDGDEESVPAASDAKRERVE